MSRASFVTVNVYAWLPDSGRSAAEFFPPTGAGIDEVFLSAEWEQEEELPDGWTMARISWRATTQAGSAELIRRFGTWLGYDIEADENGRQVWAGKIWEMTLAAGHLTRQVSLDDIANSITADHSAGTLTATTNDDSIARFGTIEQHLDLSDLDATAAQNRVDALLQVAAWPQMKVLDFSGEQLETSLEVVAYSYIETGKWLTTPTASVGAGTAISDAISDLLTADFPHCAVGNITENTETVDALPAGDPLKALFGLVRLGGVADADGIRPRYRLRITNFNTVNYEEISQTPVAYLLENGLYQSQTGGAAYTAFNAPLGVVRDEYNPIGGALHLSWLLDSRDVLVTRKQAKQGDELPGYSSGDMTDSQLRAMAASGRSNGAVGGVPAGAVPFDETNRGYVTKFRHTFEDGYL